MIRQTIRHLVWFALALSLLFNAFFAIGYVKTKRQLAASGGTAPVVEAAGAAGVDADASAAARRVARELRLDDEQAEVFEELQASLAEDHALLRESFRRTEQELRETLDAPAFDLQRFRELMTQRADLHRQRMMLASDRFGEFVSVLTPEQCREVARRIAREGNRGDRDRRRDGRRRAMLERFDTNGDGRLDEQERAAAQQEWEQRRQEWWAQMAERFDANGNGELDPEEREAMQREMKRRYRPEQGRGGFGPGGPDGRGPGGPPPGGHGGAPPPPDGG